MYDNTASPLTIHQPAMPHSHISKKSDNAVLHRKVSPQVQPNGDSNSQPSGKRKSPARKLAFLCIKLAILMLVVWFVGGTLYKGCRDLASQEWTIHWPWIFAATGFYLLGLLPAGLFWFVVLKRLGQKTRLLETLRAYYIGHLGKYVPGKAMVVVLRAGLIKSDRVSASVAAASVFFETLTMMASGAFISAVIIAIWFREQTFLLLLAVGLMLVAGLPTIPWVFRLLVKLARVGKGDPQIEEKVRRVSFGTLFFGWCCMTACWTLLGLSLWATIGAFGGDTSDLLIHMPRYIACVSLAMVAGFLALVAPAGLGVREMVLLPLLVPFFNRGVGALSAEAAATLAAVLLRLVWLFAELFMAATLFLLVRPRAVAPEIDTSTDTATGDAVRPHFNPAETQKHIFQK